MREVRVLWTGGWDSTFRIVELSRQEVIIKPIYVYDKDRQSREYELVAMENIIKALNNKSETKAKIEPVEIINRDDIPEDNEISKAYEIIHAKTNLGSQYDYLARLAKTYPGIELGIELGGHYMMSATKELGEIIYRDGIGYIDKENSTKELNMVLGSFSFPIIEKTETDMLNLIKQWGYEDVMSHIWFCHQPIGEEACGFCHPCVLKMNSNMELLLPLKAQRRYRRYEFTKKILGEKKADKIFKQYKRVKNYINRRRK